VRLFVVFMAACMSWSQTDRGDITGTVSDTSGAIVPDVEVTAINLATNVRFSTMSTGSGTYRVPLLPPGTYNVSCSKSGFKQALIENVRVAVGATVDVDVILQVGAARQVVTVEGGAAEQLQTVRSTPRSRRPQPPFWHARVTQNQVPNRWTGPFDRKSIESCIAAARAALGDQAAEEAWRAGAALSLGEAVGYALQLSPEPAIVTEHPKAFQVRRHQPLSDAYVR